MRAAPGRLACSWLNGVIIQVAPGEAFWIPVISSISLYSMQAALEGDTFGLCAIFSASVRLGTFLRQLLHLGQISCRCHLCSSSLPFPAPTLGSDSPHPHSGTPQEPCCTMLRDTPDSCGACLSSPGLHPERHNSHCCLFIFFFYLRGR